MCPLCGTFSELSTIHSAIASMSQAVVVATTAADVSGYGGFARVATIASFMSMLESFATLAMYEVIFAGGSDCQAHAAMLGVVFSLMTAAASVSPYIGKHLTAGAKTLIQGRRFLALTSGTLASQAAALNLDNCDSTSSLTPAGTGGPSGK